MNAMLRTGPSGARFFAALVLATGLAVPGAAAQAASGEHCPASAALPALPPARFDDGPTIAPAALAQDLDAWLAGLYGINPDPARRADPALIGREAARIRAQLTHPMTRRAAWLLFATLNPYLNDGHAGIVMPNYREALAAHLKAGGRIVPLEVRFARDGSLRVFDASPGPLRRGDRLLALNGHDVDSLLAAMSALAIGDTPGSRRAFLERRFAMLYGYLYGDTSDYDVSVRREPSGCSMTVRLPGGTHLPQALEPDPSAQELFAWRVLPGNIGYLRVDAFASPLKGEFEALTHEAFATFRTRRVRALIIDVRENGGGDDPLWQQDLVNHFTTQPYVQLSHYAQRVMPDNADPGDVIGTVRSADYHQRFTPPPDDPVRFQGPVYVLGGPYSYSATIQFMVAAQDFHLARIAGEETAALACQSGQVHRIGLAWSGLSATTPLIAYTRPSGQGCARGVLPDVAIPIDEVDPDATLEALRKWILRHG